jgi:hypothetical protein
MDYLKNLPYQVKIALSVLGSAIVVLSSNGDMLTTLLTQPLAISLPIILPKLVATGAFGGSLFHMQANGKAKPADKPAAAPTPPPAA